MREGNAGLRVILGTALALGFFLAPASAPGVSHDVMEVRRLERLLARLDDAHRRFDEPAERHTRREIRAFLMRETGDARHQVMRDRRELRRSGDFRDDARDLATSRGRLARQQEILYELRTLQPAIRRNHPQAEARERELFQEFLVIARRDAAATGRELGEDRRELREDRRKDRR